MPMSDMEFGMAYLERRHVRMEVSALCYYAYRHGYDIPSDGMTIPIPGHSQLDYEGLGEHPLGVGHDAGFREGCRNPFVREWLITSGHDPWDEVAARRCLDVWFRWGLFDCGHWIIGFPLYVFLRAGGLTAWNHYRNAERAGRFGHIMNKELLDLYPPGVGGAT